MHPRNHRSARLSGVLTTAAMSFGALIVLGALDLGVSRAAAPSALAARTFSLSESGNLRLTSRHGFTLNEQGAASGTITGTIYVHLKIVSTSRVTAEINTYSKGNSISGFGTASYRREGTTGNFSGSLSIDRGTGSFANVQGSGLSFSGTIQRSNYAVTVHVSGRVSE
jgi:polyisoprenoid-binding protein YceI